MSDRIDIYLRTVQARLASLPDIERRLTSPVASVSASQRRVDQDDLREGWDLVMANLGWLDEAYQAAKMSESQAGRYLALMPQVRDALPLVRKRGLGLPPPPVLRRAAVTRQSEPAAASG